MTLNQVLEYMADNNCVLFGPTSVEDQITLNSGLTVEGEGMVLTFSGHFSQIQLVGQGPFIFRQIHFKHEHELGPSFFLCQDANVVFEDCSFEGAWGGQEESLASAVKALGRSRVSFDRCRFRSNDQHLVLDHNAKAEFRQSELKDARADGIILKGKTELSGTEMEVCRSGWSAITLSSTASVQLHDSTLGENGCHGLELNDDTRYSGQNNHFHANGYNGIALAGRACAFAQGDQLISNGLCGIDLGEQSSAVLKWARATHNQSHGIQARDSARVDLADCSASNNETSGVALFNAACLDGEDFNMENNGYAGLQSGDECRVTLCRANATNNTSTSVLCFGTSSLVLERSRLTESGGHGVQLAEHCYAVIRDCEVMENKRSAVVFAGQSRGLVQGSTLAHNHQDGLVTADESKVTALENLVRSNGRDGILILSSGHGQLLENQSLKNGRYGLFAGPSSRPLLCDNICSENEMEEIVLETQEARSALRGAGPAQETSQELHPGVTVSVEDGPDLHLPFEPKTLERSMLVALAKHGRLSEAALGKVAKTRRVGGAMENLIDRLNKAGMPIIRHDGQGPEGNIYALKVDTTRQRKTSFTKTETTSIQGRQIC